MRTVEECYEYVIARRNERAAQRRKKRELVLKTAVPVCGIAVMVGVGFVVRNGITGMTEIGNSSNFSESSTVNNESTAPSAPTSSNVTSNVDNSGENSAGGDTSHTSEPPDDKPAYDGVFKGVNSSYVVGPPMSYEEIMEMLEPDEEHPMWDVDSFYLVETVRALSFDECEQLAGWEDILSGNMTVYEIKVLEDLISGEKTNRTERILVTMGTAEWQDSGDPIYAPGEKFTVILAKPYEGSDFLRTPGAFAFRYDVASDDDGNTVLYSRESELDVLQLDTAEDIDEFVITSTTHNPAHYTQKLSLNALVEFLRSDWEQRGMSSHFDNA